MVLMRRKDKRKGNESEEIIVASDSSIVANKGVRSLGGARTGRFAADMRVNVGGYGRADKTWGVDHPWHQTQTELFSSISSRDHMEEGALVKEELSSKQEVKGASRAALKKKKNKLKKMGLSAAEAAAAAAAEIEKTKQEALAAAVAEKERREKIAEERKKKKQAKREENIEKDIEEMARQEAALDEALAIAQKEDGGNGKKRKRANRNKKKKAKHASSETGENSDDDAHEQHEDQDESDVESDDNEDANDSDDNDGESAAQLAKEAALKKAKKEKRDKEKQEKKDKKEAYVASIEEKEAAKKADLEAREAIAKEYEAVVGTEIATKSGLIIQDSRIGKGRLADIGEMVTVKYLGKLGKDGLVFGKGMLSTNYGTGSVIAGWEEGLATMRAGGLRFLTIPSELAYGESGKGGKIPPNSTLYFEVELVRIGKRKREAIGKDEMPLPSAFQRKRIKEKKPDEKKAQQGGKKRRRKNSV
uniref:peptidylprolyl isomerase n=1 Tax=Globisporangium ultimum (strain ATCC 200006 / CBS 805.95 / DAOM BR144) TaxID=431595 RepID=K3X046_GLOUD